MPLLLYFGVRPSQYQLFMFDSNRHCMVLCIFSFVYCCIYIRLQTVQSNTITFLNFEYVAGDVHRELCSAQLSIRLNYRGPVDFKAELYIFLSDWILISRKRLKVYWNHKLSSCVFRILHSVLDKTNWNTAKRKI